MSTGTQPIIQTDDAQTLTEREQMVDVIEILMAKNRIRSRAELARRVPISRSALYTKMNATTPFDSDELRILARLFEVPVGTFFADPAEVEIRSRCSSPSTVLRVIDGQKHDNDHSPTTNIGADLRLVKS